MDALDLDLTVQLRGNVSLERLVRFVAAQAPQNEADWLEWKVGVDLRGPAGQLAVAKQVIGFANRDPDRATRNCGGCAYVVLGVEPGNLAGQESIDPADLVAGLGRYIGESGPAWSPQWVVVDGVEVLVITVEPPAKGDSIHVLRKEGPSARAGTPYVRRPGRSDPASPDDMEMLQARLLDRITAARSLSVDVEVENAPLPWLDTSAEAAKTWLHALRSRSLASFDRQRRSADTPTEPRSGLVSPPSGMSEIAKAVSAAALFKEEPETRSADEFRSEVEAHLEDCKEVLPAIARSLFVEDRLAVLVLRLVNPSERNLPGVMLEVVISGEVSSFKDAPERPPWPKQPRPWGPIRRPLLEGIGELDQYRDPSRSMAHPALPSAIPSIGRPRPSFNSNNHGSTTIRYDPIDIRPGYAVRLVGVPLLVEEAGTSLIAQWHATSTGWDGVASGDLSIPLGEPSDLSALLARDTH